MSAIVDRDAAAFEPHRRALIGLAYRMLGSRAEAEDVVQDAYLRWHAADRAAIGEPRRFLGKVVTRLCLDRMKSARARRELYVGQWLPEPVVDEVFEDEHAGELAHDISVALVLLLERLSPLERASFLLHDVFGLDFTEIARALDRNEAACRQLADDAVLYTDGGGKRVAALNPIRGADKIARFFEGVARKNAALATIGARPAIVNGMAGFVLHERDGSIDTMAFEHRDGRIVAIYVVRNPDKLQHVSF